jgi:hypothetical protein
VAVISHPKAALGFFFSVLPKILLKAMRQALQWNISHVLVCWLYPKPLP